MASQAMLVVALLGGVGCAWFRGENPIDPTATFAAHNDSGGLVIDKMEGGQYGRLVPGGNPFSSGPQLLIDTGNGPPAALWIVDPDVVVRQSGDPSAPAIGRVDASWDDGAIRLTFVVEGNGTYHTTVFDRVSGGVAPNSLGPPADLTFHLARRYLAVVSDAQGAPAGWLRVRITGPLAPARTYEGVLPAAVNGPLAVAAVVRLEREFKEQRADTVNPYIGN